MNTTKGCEANSVLWNSGNESDKLIVRGTTEGGNGRKRKLRYVSCIYVVKNPQNPETQGKVFLWNYGSKIYDKIKAIMSSNDPDNPGINPFCFWNGRNFNLNICTVANYANYDQSAFAANNSELFKGDDAAKEALWKTQYKLQELISPDKFKSFDELNKKFQEVLGSGSVTRTVEQSVAPVSRSAVAQAAPSAPFKPNTPAGAVEEDDALAFLRKQIESE